MCQPYWLLGYISNIQTPHNNVIIISMTIANYDVKIILVDNGSSADILFYDTFQRMKLSTNRLTKVNTPLVRFFRDSIIMEGKIILPAIAR